MGFHYDRDHRFEAIAAQPGYHPFHLERAWIPHMTDTVQQLATSFRLDQAIELGPGGTKKTDAFWRVYLNQPQRRVTLMDVDPIVGDLARSLGPQARFDESDFESDWAKTLKPGLVICLGNTLGNFPLETITGWMKSLPGSLWWIGLDRSHDLDREYGDNKGPFAQLLRTNLEDQDQDLLDYTFKPVMDGNIARLGFENEDGDRLEAMPSRRWTKEPWKNEFKDVNLQVLSILEQENPSYTLVALRVVA